MSWLRKEAANAAGSQAVHIENKRQNLAKDKKYPKFHLNSQ